MKKFLAIYIGMASTPKGSEWHSMDAEKRKKLEASGIKAWGEWVPSRTKLPQGCLRITRTSRYFPATLSRSWSACRFRGRHSTGNAALGRTYCFCERNWSGRQDSNLRPLAPHGFQDETGCDGLLRIALADLSEDT
jgi:hypothetical protein